MKRFQLIYNIGRLVTMEGTDGLGIIEKAACLIKHGKVEWIGEEGDALHLEEYQVEKIDAKGSVVMPGLVDCHTHLVHGGSREIEAAMRARGKSYEDIAKEGGGILSTVTSTREASFEELCRSAEERANEALRKGVTTVEVKSGYGLNLESELKMLRVIKWLNDNHPSTFIPTFLGAHTIPPEFKDSRSAYLKELTEKMIPAVCEEGLARFVDIFVEKIAYTVKEAEEILKVAKDYGLEVKLHADQLSSFKGGELAARFSAVSADHLEYVSDEDIEKMIKADVIGVMLPGATFYLGQKDYAPARKLIDEGLTVAIATDYNPGSNPSLDLFLAATIGMTQMKMTMEECLRGITVNAARALNLTDGKGVIRKGGVADLIICDSPSEYYPLYRYATNHVKMVFKNGRIVYKN